jgi:hypothetical protein
VAFAEHFTGVFEHIIWFAVIVWSRFSNLVSREAMARADQSS